MLVWRRTNICGEVIPHHDFSATDKTVGRTVGRIYRIPQGPSEGRWMWSMTYRPSGGVVDFRQLPLLHGTEDSKAAAVERVGWAYEVMLYAATKER